VLRMADEYRKQTALCEADMALQVVAEGDAGGAVQVFGQVMENPPNPFYGDVPRDLAAGIPVEIKVNLKGGSASSYTATTDADGKFQLTLEAGDPAAGLHEGWNWIFASAQCPAWEDYGASQSKGYAEFKLAPAAAEAAQPEELAAAPIPAGPIQVPDVVGLPFDEAVAKLEDLGFRTTWIDGSSALELGTVYDQRPAVGGYQVPHRTTVLLYRTTEQYKLEEIIIGEWGKLPNTMSFSQDGKVTYYDQSWADYGCPIFYDSWEVSNGRIDNIPYN